MIGSVGAVATHSLEPGDVKDEGLGGGRVVRPHGREMAVPRLLELLPRVGDDQALLVAGEHSFEVGAELRFGAVPCLKGLHRGAVAPRQAC